MSTVHGVKLGSKVTCGTDIKQYGMNSPEHCSLVKIGSEVTCGADSKQQGMSTHENCL